MIRRKTFFILLALFWALTACTAPAPLPPPPTNQPPATFAPSDNGPPLPTGASALWVGWLRGPDDPNPFIADWAESFTIFDLVYSSMYQLQLDGSYAPDLVESVSVSPDQKVWTYTIREDVVFHDGRPLTARDVAFSIHLYGTFSDVTALDERTVQIRLSKPIPNMEGHLLYHYILPQHIWGRYENSLDTYDNLEMIGSGPFKVAVYAQDSFIHLQKVADHYLFSPKIEDIVFLAYPDESTLKEGILSGDVSLILNLPYFEVESLAEDPTIEVVTGLPLYPEFEEIVFNQLAPEDCPPFEEDSSFVLPDDLTLQPCSGHPALRDRTVRLALSHAVDKTTLLDQVLRGRGASGLSVIPPGLQDYFDPTLQDYPYDPQQAKDLLDQAGYLDTDGDGVREMPATSEEPGRPLSFRLYYLGPDLLFELLLEHLTPMWQEIGIELNIRALDADTIIYLCCPTYDYDMILWGWGVEPEPGNFFNIFDTASIATGGNESGFSDPDYDILNAVQHTETDPAQRLKLITQLQTIIHTEAVNLVFFYPDAVAAYRSDHFTGWNLDAPHLALDNIHSLITLEPATP